MNYYRQLSIGKRKTEKEKVLKNIVKSKYDTYNDLDELLYKAREYLDSDLIQKQLQYCRRNTRKFI